MAGVFFCISPNHCSDSTGPCSERHAGKLGPDSQRLSRSTSQAQIAGANIFSNKLALMRLCRGIFTEGKLGACLSDGIPWDVEEFDLSIMGKIELFYIAGNPIAQTCAQLALNRQMTQAMELRTCVSQH